MNNIYYKYSKTDVDAGKQVKSSILLTAKNTNSIVIGILQGNAIGGATYGEITLNEKEQDDLIASIKERRNVIIEPISATGDEQSMIHPNH